LKLGDIDAPEMRRLEHEHLRLAGQPLFIDDEGGLSIMDVRARARRAVKKHGVKLILVDYLQLLSAKNAQSRENEVGFVSRGLKAMAMELKIPVMAAAQLNRQAESRGDNRPKMSDLRDSGQIEADADIVSLLYRPGYYDSGTDPQETQTTEWTIAKHRAGRTGMIPLEWHPPYTRFDTVGDRFTDEPDVPWGEEKAADLFPVPHKLMEVINE
jgi:replicative DNA helicase